MYHYINMIGEIPLPPPFTRLLPHRKWIFWLPYCVTSLTASAVSWFNSNNLTRVMLWIKATCAQYNFSLFEERSISMSSSGSKSRLNVWILIHQWLVRIRESYMAAVWRGGSRTSLLNCLASVFDQVDCIFAWFDNQGSIPCLCLTYIIIYTVHKMGAASKSPDKWQRTDFLNIRTQEMP